MDFDWLSMVRTCLGRLVWGDREDRDGGVGGVVVVVVVTTLELSCSSCPIEQASSFLEDVDNERTQGQRMPNTGRDEGANTGCDVCQNTGTNRYLY